MALVVGDRVRLTNDVERYPHFIVAYGKTGTVTEVGEENVIVTMDEVIEGAEEWDNAIHWHLPNEEDPEADLEVIS